MRRGLRAATPAAFFVARRGGPAARVDLPTKAKGPACGPGLPLLSDRGLILEAAELEVQARADHGKVIAIATVVAEADELVLNHRSAGVRHADHVAAPKGAIVVTVAVEADIQAFDLRGH